jgi:hypothetical protein
MKLFMKKQVEESLKGSSIPRIQNTDTAELLSWFNNLIMNLGSSFDSWRYDNERDEVTMTLNTLNEVWKELKERKAI